MPFRFSTYNFFQNFKICMCYNLCCHLHHLQNASLLLEIGFIAKINRNEGEKCKKKRQYETQLNRGQYRRNFRF